MRNCTWDKVKGRYICKAKHCPHWDKGSCSLGKVTLFCDNEDCFWNSNHHCRCMDVHLDADGRCLSFTNKEVKDNAV